MDLEPRNGTLDEKVKLNRLGCGPDYADVIALRVSRLNHACMPNAIHIWEETTNTKVVHATRLIKGKRTLNKLFLN